MSRIRRIFNQGRRVVGTPYMRARASAPPYAAKTVFPSEHFGASRKPFFAFFPGSFPRFAFQGSSSRSGLGNFLACAAVLSTLAPKSSV